MQYIVACERYDIQLFMSHIYIIYICIGIGPLSLSSEKHHPLLASSPALRKHDDKTAAPPRRGPQAPTRAAALRANGTKNNWICRANLQVITCDLA